MVADAIAKLLNLEFLVVESSKLVQEESFFFVVLFFAWSEN